MKAVVFGGGGYIGRHLAQTRMFDELVSLDHRHTAADVQYIDVRVPIPASVAGDLSPDWIFLFAAVHREPGHETHEYFETNIAGARNIAAYADAVGCTNIFFMSSSSVYGPVENPTDESAPPSPVTPYGASKLSAELILRGWQMARPGRTLRICRSGVVYGPGDPGNVLRMIRMVRKGRFVFPGRRDIRKSYAYIAGLLDSIAFVLPRPEPVIIYNYVERKTETLEEMVDSIQRELGGSRAVLSLPRRLVVPAAYVVELLTAGRSPVHPARVKKLATPTHLVPAWLIENGFEFRFDFSSSLTHWRSITPGDFM
jgi:GlcNAc-P-P-Und epimerase